jgi:hypothetical protein
VRPVGLAVLILVTLATLEPPAQILQIYRDSVKEGGEAAFKAIEEDAARICADLRFPHPHLAIESLTGPNEVWWLNAFESEAERQQVTVDYAENPALVAALDGIAKRKEDVTGTPVNVFATYRADLSRGVSWNPAGARFIVVAVTKRDPQLQGAVFEAPDGTRFLLRPVGTRSEAEVLAKSAGADTTVFVVRPYWGMPAKEWIDADPEFWKSNPMAGTRR